MATASGQSSPALNRVVVDQFGRFNVFQLVRLLRHRPGGAWPLGLRLRFRADLRPAFPGHEITRLARAKPMPQFRHEGRPDQAIPARLEVRTPNYCLASELGPLPEPFLEWVREQERLGGHAFAAFLDVFNQRVHVLRHDLRQRSLRALDPALPQDTEYAGRLSALMGLALPTQQAQIPLPMRTVLGMAGLLANERKSGAVVSQILTVYLGVRSTLKMLVGRWRDIEAQDRISLGRARHALGRQSLLGRRTWDARAAVRLDVGRLSYESCCALLPLRRSGGYEQWPKPAHRGLTSMVRLLLDRRYDCEVSIQLDSATVPASRLDPSGKNGSIGLRLGQTAWLGRHRGRPVRFLIRAFDEESIA